MLADTGVHAFFVLAMLALPALVFFVLVNISFFVARAIGMGWGALVAALLACLATMLVKPTPGFAQGVLSVMLFLGLWGLAIVMSVSALVRWVF